VTQEPLAGGIGNRGGVVRVAGTVRRPAGRHSPATSLLLAHLAAVGFPAPVPRGRDDEGREVFGWIEGDVPVPPFPPWSRTDAALASVGSLLRRYHEAVRTFSPPARAPWSDELADPDGGPIVCHNDVCPENVVFRAGAAVALLDFDLAAPGRRVWDLAHAARMWIPLVPPADERGDGDLLRRLAVLVRAYGLEPPQVEAFVDAIVVGKRLGTRFVERRVRAGEPAFVEAWERRGGKAGDDRLVAWLEASRESFVRALGGDGDRP
jgi:aminoglycoside phosphotransferase (APT) family kinase protein